MHSVFIEDAFYQSTESLGNKSENQKNVAIACLLGRVAADASQKIEKDERTPQSAI
jgi:hypothetical protein